MSRRRALATGAAALIAAALIAGCAPAVARVAAAAAERVAAPTAVPAATAGARTTYLTVWSVNSDGPRFRAILTGAVGDYGTGVTVLPNGTVDPGHTSELELNLSLGSFRLSIARLDSEFVRDVANIWPYDRASCSVHGTVSGEVPVVAGSGTGGYRGIAGTFTVSITLDEVDRSAPHCDARSPFLAQLILIAGTGSVRP
ncbi:MAG TPA: hypothetical protein VF060_02140 [Trebonia sp.]